MALILDLSSVIKIRSFLTTPFKTLCNEIRISHVLTSTCNSEKNYQINRAIQRFNILIKKTNGKEAPILDDTFNTLEYPGGLGAPQNLFIGLLIRGSCKIGRKLYWTLYPAFED